MAIPLSASGALQAEIQAFLEDLVGQGRERGIQVAAYHQGRLVADAWAGHIDASMERPIGGDTLFPVFSVTKGIAATLVHRLVERGVLRYEDRISRWWPEFGCRGKEEITLRQGLDHSAGIPQMPSGIGYPEMCDWDTICRAVATLEPLWTPGTKAEYHPITFGWIVGEVACRATGKTFPQLVREEICDPLGTDDIYIGIPGSVESRVAVLEEPDAAIPVPTDAPEGVPAWVGPLYGMMNRPDARRACIPGSSGIMTARALARHYAALLPGGIDGVALLPESRVLEASRPRHPEGEDEFSRRIALGYQRCLPPLGDSSAWGHAGYGGSIGFAEPSHRFAIGITRSLFSKKGGVNSLIDRIREGLGISLPSGNPQ